MNFYCSEILGDELAYECGFVAPNSKIYEYVIETQEDMLVLSDSLGRRVPIDITSIDQVLSALFDARNSMLVPRIADTYVSNA